MKIEFYDQKTIDEIEWPDTEEAKMAQALLLPMIKEGVEKYIRNVATDLYLLKIGELILPLTVNQREYNNSYLTSNYFLIKHLEEKLKKKSSPFLPFQKFFIGGAGLFLKGIKINKVAIVNNWLLTCNLYPKINSEQIKAITAFLTKRFPDHLILFRSLNTYKGDEMTHDLKKQKYRLVGSRSVFIYDPEKKQSLPSKALYHHRRDRRLLDSEGYEVVRNDEITKDEITKMLQLYNYVYLHRHTEYSPQYTEKFVRQAIEKGFFHLVALKKDGEIHGVMGCHARNGSMTIPFFGYDADQGGPNHIYRMLTTLAIDEAEKRNLVLNDGSGGSAPKQYRGMKPIPEYIALYDRHLPFYRRLFWGFAEKLVKWISFSTKEASQ